MLVVLEEAIGSHACLQSIQQRVAEFMVVVLEDAIRSHACLQSIQQWVAEFMVSARGSY
jgi:hypothetical protein